MIEPSPHPVRARMEKLNGEALARVAAYFQVLAEPTRLQILNLLREQERNVGELAQLCGYSAANISRHLSLLSQHGFVARETRGNSAYYRIADASVYELCDHGLRQYRAPVRTHGVGACRIRHAGGATQEGWSARAPLTGAAQVLMAGSAFMRRAKVRSWPG